jgi:hypothetical protein
MPARDDGRFRLHARLRRKFDDGFLAWPTTTTTTTTIAG